uniref:Cupin type-2 domain-containing protein n=1 Tax=Streptomyces ambofaciens TaxID=1889 RepID=Q0JWN3_STRAM|nr:conserved hypothetical protein [Streptomyces ambofaciens]CAK51131.1 conserved hypothetical protein [Streptomyces ambofaciens]
MHDDTDEFFLVLAGELRVSLREPGGERTVLMPQGAVFTVPRGTEHKPYAPSGAAILMFEPTGTPTVGDRRTRSQSTSTRQPDTHSAPAPTGFRNATAQDVSPAPGRWLGVIPPSPFGKGRVGDSVAGRDDRMRSPYRLGRYARNA